MATGGQPNYDQKHLTDASVYRFGIVVSQWHQDITQALENGCIETLTNAGVNIKNIISWKVPGSFELIYGTKKMLQTISVDVVIAIGVVIRGETAHFDYVCQGVTQGIKDLNVQYEIPVIYCVLTDDNEQQSIARSGGNKGNKGSEAALAAIQMVRLKKK